MTSRRCSRARWCVCVLCALPYMVKCACAVRRHRCTTVRTERACDAEFIRGGAACGTRAGRVDVRSTPEARRGGSRFCLRILRARARSEGGDDRSVQKARAKAGWLSSVGLRHRSAERERARGLRSLRTYRLHPTDGDDDGTDVRSRKS